MKSADMIIEFFVTGAVGFLGIALFLYQIGVDPMWEYAIPEDAMSKLALGFLAIPVLYYFGIAVHHASWRMWRPLFHRRWFAAFATHDKYQSLREMATHAHAASEDHAPQLNQASPRHLAFVMDWCRFKTFQQASAQSQREYLRQFHLYRITYGPLSALAIALLGSFWRAGREVASGRPGWSIATVLILLAFLFLLWDSGRHRAFRMWKYSCYCAALANNRHERSPG